MNVEIKHEISARRFSMLIEGSECSVEYEMVEDAPLTIELYRTFVPPSLRGKGIAEKLLAHVANYAAEKGLLIIPTCSYAVFFFKRHPQYATVLADNVNLDSGGSCRLR